MQGTLSRGLQCRCGNLLVPPKMRCITAVMKRPQMGTVDHLLPSIKIIARCTGLLLGTRQQHGKHVGRHLHWQSTEELTQLFPPSLILDGILRVTEKNTLARNGDNSAWGKNAHRALLGKTLKNHLIILYTYHFSPP